MSKKCPKCLEIYDDNHGFCSNCGSRLIDHFEDLENEPVLNLGDANAITGGVNINRSKNITSHDTHYHSTTVHERSKSDSELRLEATNQLRYKAEGIIAERGRIDSVAMSQLRPFASQLGIDDETFKTIIKEVRSNRNGSATGLGAANARYLQQAQHAVQINDMDGLSNLTPRLEAMAAISQDDNVQYLYYLTLSLLYPIKSMEVYEHQTDENYWRSFWGIISYIRTGKYAEATKVLALFDPVRFEKSEDDQNLLEAYFNIMKEENDSTQDFLDEILGEPSEQIKPLLRAIEARLYEEDPDSLEVSFYFERVLSKSDVVIKTSKKAETPPSVEDVVPSANNEEKKTVNTISIDDNNTLPKIDNNIKADAFYSEACAASGAKRVMLLQKAAEAGSLDAMYDLSDCYCDGEGVNKDMGSAIKWLIKASDSNHLKSQAALGVLYMTGAEGFEQNYAMSEKYLTTAANRDFPKAQLALSYLYLGMEEYNKAIVWARKVLDIENEAATILGQIYTNGLGVEQNMSEGLKYYEKAAKGGDADAQNIVGNIYSDPNAGVQDVDKSFEFYQMAAAQNHLYGMFNLGLCYASGDGCEADMLKAHEWIEKAANEGCHEAQEWLNSHPIVLKALAEDEVDFTKMTLDEKIEYTWFAFVNNDLSKVEECVKILRKYANEGIPRAQCGLAQYYQYGFGVKQNLQQAAAWYKKSAEQGYAASQYHLGIKYEEGYGCTVNFQEAAKWYRKASIQGYPDALFRLGLLYIEGNGVVMNKAKGVELIQKASKQGYQDAVNWLENETLNLNSNTEPNITIEKICVNTDGVKQLLIQCDWIANNMKGECFQFRVNLRAKSGKRLKHDASDNQWYYLKEKFIAKNDSYRFKDTCISIDEFDFNMKHNEEKKIEFNIEIYKWGTDECLYYSKIMNFTVWSYFNFFSKNKFEIRSQQCLP